VKIGLDLVRGGDVGDGIDDNQGVVKDTVSVMKLIMLFVQLLSVKGFQVRLRNGPVAKVTLRMGKRWKQMHSLVGHCRPNLS